ncbi:MAG TPA: protein jag [Candidatus Merdenecus merdavium]|nr:protein jag [Candidatus Merdenecus merdavium]
MDYIEISAKTIDEAITKALIKLEASSDQIEYEVISEGSSGFLGFGSKPAVIKVTKKKDISQKAMDFIESVCEKMNIPVEVIVEYQEEQRNMDIVLKGKNMGVLIGKRGQVLDSLQYLTSLVVNKGEPDYIRVKLDTENYRHRRKETLENLARNIAYKVKKTRKSVSLEPMNPYERRLIHSALQNDKYVTTYSEGDEPYRKVVVTLKK